jgi:hypothetical protein
VQILPFWQTMTSPELADDIAKLEAEVEVLLVLVKTVQVVVVQVDIEQVLEHLEETPLLNLKDFLTYHKFMLFQLEQAELEEHKMR